MKKAKVLWYRIPEQIRHLVVPVVIVVFGYLLARHFLIPSDFGLLGHFRASSIAANVEREMKYGGSASCTECHDPVVAAKKNGYHRDVACESCHGPSLAHTQDPEKVKPAVLRTRTLCLLCHEYLQTRPTGFPQVISDSHNPLKPCISCHQPHVPKPPQALKGCEACHAKVMNVLAVSNHSNLTCTNCHDAPKEHFSQPREYTPKKIQNRQICLTCHDKAATSPKEIPRIDGATHGEKYFCWQCHFPHRPEAR
jgi:predicted CXXCH cytochrome family protein